MTVIKNFKIVVEFTCPALNMKIMREVNRWDFHFMTEEFEDDTYAELSITVPCECGNEHKLEIVNG